MIREVSKRTRVFHSPTDLLPPPRGRPTLVPRPARGREESEGTGCTPGAEPGKKNIKLRMKRTRVVGLDKMPTATSEEAMPQNNGRRQSTRERRTCDQQRLEMGSPKVYCRGGGASDSFFPNRLARCLGSR